MARSAALPALLAAVDATTCAELKDCGSCIALENLVQYKCHWCDVDQACHALGSPESPCASGLENDRCSSKSKLSACDQKAPSEAIKPSQVHFALAGSAGLRVARKTDSVPTGCSLVSLAGSSESSSIAAAAPVQHLQAHGHHRVATATGLKPGRDYQFHVECDGVVSDTLSFHVLDGGLQEAHFLVVGDMG